MKAHHFDESGYLHFCTPDRFRTTLLTLLGTIEGICIDNIVDDDECQFLRQWLIENNDICQKAPMNEIIPSIELALLNGYIDKQSVLDIRWLCKQLVSDEFKAIITNDIKILQGIVVGISADSIISPFELENLQDWIQDHDYLKGHWPYDEVDSLITKVLQDHVVDAEEQEELLSFFTQFGDVKFDTDIGLIKQRTETISGICCCDPQIEFTNRRFCITGHSTQHSRGELEKMITTRGGSISNTISKKLNYLVVGAERNLCWQYNCYGRKIEAAMQLRKAGHPIIIVHETDLLDATY
ncbi:MAG: BRCT domain-containing protein [Armatimonadota bacterium]